MSFKEKIVLKLFFKLNDVAMTTKLVEWLLEEEKTRVQNFGNHNPTLQSSG